MLCASLGSCLAVDTATSHMVCKMVIKMEKEESSLVEAGAGKAER